jgi:hypothetical protein
MTKCESCDGTRLCSLCNNGNDGRNDREVFTRFPILGNGLRTYVWTEADVYPAASGSAISFGYNNIYYYIGNTTT